MSDCRRVRRQMVDHLDSPPNEEMGRHLARCASCREELDALRSARAALESVHRVSVPERIWAQVQERIRSIEEERSWLWRLFATRPGYAFAAGVAVILIGAASLLISPAGQAPPLLLMLLSPFSPVGISCGGG